MRGQWVYLRRAADRDGNTVDFRLSATRDVVAAKGCPLSGKPQSAGYG